MKIFLAGGEGLTAKRQEALFQAGCRHRLTSFFSGTSVERVLKAASEFEESQSNSNKNEPSKQNETDSA